MDVFHLLFYFNCLEHYLISVYLLLFSFVWFLCYPHQFGENLLVKFTNYNYSLLIKANYINPFQFTVGANKQLLH